MKFFEEKVYLETWQPENSAGNFYQLKEDSFFMVEVFKTNVRSNREAKRIIQELAKEFPEHKINFDLSDCDKILRVQGNDISEREIINIVNSLRYNCELLQ